MAHSTYDNMWQEAMGELGEQLHVEGVEDEEDPTAPQSVRFFLNHIYEMARPQGFPKLFRHSVPYNLKLTHIN